MYISDLFFRAENVQNVQNILIFDRILGLRTTASQRSRRGISASPSDGVKNIGRVSPMPRFFSAMRLKRFSLVFADNADPNRFSKSADRYRDSLLKSFSPMADRPTMISNHDIRRKEH